MRKLFHFDSPPGEYTSEACVVSCFDARFDLAIRKFLKRRGILFIHTHCGAYQGSSDKAFLTEELGRAAGCVREAIPGLAVESYLIDFEGVWDVAAAA
jgi:hypothetical protein